DNNNNSKLDVGEAWVYTTSYTVTQADLDNQGGGDGNLDNTATVTSTQIPTPQTATANVPLVYSPDLKITKTDGTDTAVPGTATTYTIVVSNIGNITENAQQVTDNTPANVTSDTWTFFSSTGGG